MKKITLVFLFVMMLPLVFSCEKERELDDKMEGQAGATEDDFGLNEKELAEVSAIKNELIGEIKKGDSITIVTLRHEIDSLKAELHHMKAKK
jgi:hypothetical protein